MSAHTPGPWKWVKRTHRLPQQSNYKLAGLVGADNVEVCNFGDAEEYYPTEGEEPNEADKALIAAAPCLLEALTDLCDNYDEAIQPWDKRWNKARAAIEKARLE